MTPTEKQKCIAEQMPYNPQFAFWDTKKDSIKHNFRCKRMFGIQNGRNLQFGSESGYTTFDIKSRFFNDKCAIVLRPISDITKEIIHKGYNNNQPFIPLVELAKMSEKDFTLKSLHNDNTESAAEYIIMTDWGNGVQECIIRFAYSYDLNRFYKFQVTPFRKPFGVAYQQNMFDLLHQLHFDDRSLIELGEAISTDIINPYSK